MPLTGLQIGRWRHSILVCPFVRASVRSFVRYQSCERDILKADERISMQTRKIIKFWCSSKSGCESTITITFPVPLKLRIMALCDIFSLDRGRHRASPNNAASSAEFALSEHIQWRFWSFHFGGATGVATLSSRGGDTTNTFVLNYRVCNHLCQIINT